MDYENLKLDSIHVQCQSVTKLIIERVFVDNSSTQKKHGSIGFTLVGGH